MSATWWSAPEAGDIVPAGPGSMTVYPSGAGDAEETYSADVRATLTATAGPGATVAAVELRAVNVEGRRPSRSILLELTRLDCVLVGIGLLAAAGADVDADGFVAKDGRPIVDDLAELAEAAGAHANDLREFLRDGMATGDHAARVTAEADRIEAASERVRRLLATAGRAGRDAAAELAAEGPDVDELRRLIDSATWRDEGPSLGAWAHIGDELAAALRWECSSCRPDVGWPEHENAHRTPAGLITLHVDCGHCGNSYSYDRDGVELDD